MVVTHNNTEEIKLANRKIAVGEIEPAELEDSLDQM
jgi:hypothetical protein